jgi:hypothetical protein
MKRLAAIFGVLALGSLAASLTGPGSDFLWGGLKPLSAILFIAFFICKLLAKEVMQYDQEHAPAEQTGAEDHQERPKTPPGARETGEMTESLASRSTRTRKDFVKLP